MRHNMFHDAPRSRNDATKTKLSRLKYNRTVPRAMLSVARLPKDDLDRVHWERCELKRCGWCLWAVKKDQWQKQFHMPDAPQESWIHTAHQENTVKFGCVICMAAKSRLNARYMTDWAKGSMEPYRIQKSSFTIHQQSNTHFRAAQLWQVLDPDEADIIPPHVAPADDVFSRVLELTRAGKCTGDVKGVGSYKKVRCMKWCLAEAVRQLKRRQIARSLAASTHQDGRKGRLAVRFTSCGDELIPFCGVLGSVNLAKDYTLDAVGMTKATIDIVRDFCTPLKNPPYKDNTAPVCNEQLVKHIQRIVELFDADAASDEQLAGKLLQGDHSAGIGEDAFFSNLRVHNKDKAHGSRRTPGRRRNVARQKRIK